MSAEGIVWAQDASVRLDELSRIIGRPIEVAVVREQELLDSLRPKRPDRPKGPDRPKLPQLPNSPQAPGRWPRAGRWAS